MKTISIIFLLNLFFIVSKQGLLVDALSFELIKQYYECKLLHMITTKDALGKYYIPDPSKPNNTLNDSFYRSLNLTNMTLNEATSFIRNIYTDLNKCTGSSAKLCKCVKSKRFEKNYALLFLNNTISSQARPIITGLTNKFRPNLLPLNRLQNFFVNGSSLPTLLRFCVEFDYTDLRLSFYNNTLVCHKEPDYMVRNLFYLGR